MIGGPKQNHLKALAHADAIMRHCKKDGIAKCEVIDTLDGFLTKYSLRFVRLVVLLPMKKGFAPVFYADRSGQHLTGELKVLGGMGLRDFQVREDRHDRRSLGLGREDQ